MTQGAKPPTQGEDGEIRTTDGDIAFCALTAVCQRTDCTETVIVAVGGSYEGRHSLNDALPKGWGFEYISYEHAGRTHANEVLHCPTHLEDPTKASPGALDPPEEDEDE